MEKKIENLENFKKAITSTIKSIIGDQNIDVVFGNAVTKKKHKYYQASKRSKHK